MLPDRKEWLLLDKANFSTDDPIFSRPEIREVAFPADAGADRKLSSL
jgi:hypothetical protein